MKTFACWITAGLVLILGSGMSRAAESVGSVVALQGSAQAVGAGGVMRALALKSEIFLNDTIKTEKASKVQVMFKDNTVLSQGENTTMVIDEYAYSPSDKAANKTSLRAMNGVFRTVTGKISQLNPDKFKVQTRMATIGIRGCDVGGRLGSEGESVYVLDLHGVDSVLVQSGGSGPAPVGGTGVGAGDGLAKTLSIAQPNKIVEISAMGRMEQRDLRPGESSRFVQSVTIDEPGEKKGESKPADGGAKQGEGQSDEKGSQPAASSEQGGSKTEPAEQTSAQGGGGGSTPVEPKGDQGGAKVAGGESKAETPSLPVAPKPEGEPVLPKIVDAPHVPDIFTAPSGPVVVTVPPEVVLDKDDDDDEEDDGDAGAGGNVSEPATTLSDATMEVLAAAGVSKEIYQALVTELKAQNVNPAIAVDAVVESVQSGGGVAEPTLVNALQESLQTVSVPVSSGGGGGSETPTPVPTPTPTPVVVNPPTTDVPDTQPPQPASASGHGTYWSWDIPTQAGVPQSVNMDRQMVLSGAAFQSIADGALFYNLQGAGSSGAIVTHQGAGRVLTGSCNLNVQVGAGSVPTWGGSFSLGNSGGDALQFQADGNISADGMLYGTPSSYLLSVKTGAGVASFGKGDLTAADINGALLGSGVAPTPISAAAGRYKFEHGGATTVNGAFGADLK